MLPSQIVQFIQNEFSAGELAGSIQLYPQVCGRLNALIRLIDGLPNAVLPSDAAQFCQFLKSLESIRVAVKMAELQTDRSATGIGPPSLRPDGGGQSSPVFVVQQILAKCPDESPPLNSAELLFVTDSAIRDGLLQDLEASRSALLNAEWKAATVLAGSLVEALLLWAIRQKNLAEIQSAVQTTKLPKSTPSDTLEWNLNQYLEVAAALNIIDPETAQQTKVAKDFRNLIHPGRAIRKGLTCDRGTALSTSAAVELVMRDLKIRFL